MPSISIINFCYQINPTLKVNFSNKNVFFHVIVRVPRRRFINFVHNRHHISEGISKKKKRICCNTSSNFHPVFINTAIIPIENVHFLMSNWFMLIAQSIKLCKKNHIESPICGKFARFTAKMFKIVIFNQVLNFCNHRRIPRTEFRRCTKPKSCCPPYSIRTTSICPF